MSKLSKDTEITLDGLARSIEKLMAKEKKSLIERAEGIRLERIHNIITAYKLIPEIGYLSEDIQDYCKKAPENPDFSKDLIEKLKNSYLAPRHDLLDQLELMVGRKNAEKTCRWYGRIYGQDNGWTYINKGHIAKWEGKTMRNNRNDCISFIYGLQLLQNRAV